MSVAHTRVRHELHTRAVPLRTRTRTESGHTMPRALYVCARARVWVKIRRHICAFVRVRERVCAGARRREREKYRRGSACILVRACVRVRYDEQKIYTCTDVYVHMHLERCACNHICAHNMSQERERERESYRSESHAHVCACARPVCVVECVSACPCADRIRVVLNYVRACACMRPTVCSCA